MGRTHPVTAGCYSSICSPGLLEAAQLPASHFSLILLPALPISVKGHRFPITQADSQGLLSSSFPLKIHIQVLRILPLPCLSDLCPPSLLTWIMQRPPTGSCSQPTHPTTCPPAVPQISELKITGLRVKFRLFSLAHHMALRDLSPAFLPCTAHPLPRNMATSHASQFMLLAPCTCSSHSAEGPHDSAQATPLPRSLHRSPLGFPPNTEVA